VAFYLRGSILRHDADDEPSDDRSDDRPQTKMVQTGAGEVECNSVIEEDIRDERNQVVESVSDYAGDEANRTGQQGHQRHPELGGRCNEECSGRRDCQFAAVHELGILTAISPGKGLIAVLVRHA
jgi:hypothetical protein